MTEYLRIKNLGQICRVVGRNAAGAALLKNPNSGRDELFHQNAVEPAPHGQYQACWMCQSPMLIWSGKIYQRAVCSPACDHDKREHYS